MKMLKHFTWRHRLVTALLQSQALHIAYLEQSVELAVALIAVGAPLLCANNLGKIPAECASKVGARC